MRLCAYTRTHIALVVQREHGLLSRNEARVELGAGVQKGIDAMKRPLEAAEEGTWPPSLRAAFARVAGLVPSKPLAVSEGGGTRWQEMFGRCLVAESHEF